MAMEHILLSDFKIYKDRDLQNTEDDNILNIILYGVTNFLEKQYGIFIEPRTETKVLDIDTDGMVVLPSSAIEIQSIKIDGQEQDVSDFYMKGNVLKSKSGLLRKGVQNLEITYKIGFDTIPEGIKLAIFILTDRIYEKVKNNATLISSITDPVAGRAVFRENLPKEFYWLIAPFVSINI